jgi:hypothetical protein
MAHRDDVEALRARLEAQERELKDAKAELDVLRAAVHRDVADKAMGEAATPFENRSDSPPSYQPGMGFSPDPRPLAPLRGETQRRLGLLILVVTTLVAGLFLATTPCPSTRYRRVAIRPPATVAEPAEGFAPFVRFARVVDPGTPAALSTDQACAVEVTPVTDSTFDCRVVVRCGDRVLYGRDERRGGTGYNHCGPLPSLIVDSAVTEDDGDPRFRMDLASGEVVIEDTLGLGIQRVELELLSD